MMRVPLPYKARHAAHSAASLWYATCGQHHARRRRTVARHVREHGLGCAFFATSEAPGGLDLPDKERARIVAEAEDALRGRLVLLGLGPIACGEPIAWHCDPLTGRRFPDGHWNARRDPAVDWKFLDEVNKHRHLYALGQAFALTGDERFRRAALQQLAVWLQVSPPVHERFWGDGLECTIRSLAWLWLLYLLNRRSPLGIEETALLVDAIRQHARFIEGELPAYRDAYNHLIARAAALVLVGVALPCLPESGQWVALGVSILAHEAARQFGREGGHREQTVGYHVFLLDAYAHVLVLCRANRIALPAAVDATLERMYDFVLQIMRPDGRLPNLGDEGIRWHQLSRAPLLEARRLLSTGAVLFGRGDMKWAAGEFSPESAWLLGAAGRRAFDALATRPPPHPPCSHLADAGLVTWRDGWRPNASYVLFDVGAQGIGRAGHGHADALAIELAVDGAPALVDSGTFTYYPRGGWRHYFRGTSAHNTLCMDGEDQAERGPDRFLWQRPAHARVRQVWATSDLAVADAEHDGYQRLAQPAVHRRILFWVARDYWLVWDVVTGMGAHRCECTFHFAPGQVALGATDGRCVWQAAASSLLLAPALPGPSFEAALVAGACDPPQGWISHAYGQREESPVLVYRASGELPLAIATLLLPFQGRAAPPVACDQVPLSVDGGAVSAAAGGCIRVELAGGTIDYVVWADAPGVKSADALVTDARVAMLRLQPDKPPSARCLPDGRLRWQGAEVD